MRIKINDKEYPLSDVQKATLAELLLLERDTLALGRSLSLGELQDISTTLDACACKAHEGSPVESCKACDTARGLHPDALWLLGATVWLAKRRAGERVSFEDAIDFDLDAVTWITEPGDKPVKKADPTQARPASGRAGSGAAGKSGKSRSRTPSFVD